MPYTLTPLQENKKRLRAEMRVKRMQLAPSNEMPFKQLASVFTAHFQLEPQQVIGSYHAFRDEMDCRYLMEALKGQGHMTALPRIIDKRRPLVFRLINDDTELERHPMGMWEPPLDAEEAEPDIILIPLLAFDRRYGRLGYGGGYYDRTITRMRDLKPIQAIGIGFSWQEITEVPMGPNDIKLDKIVTELNVF